MSREQTYQAVILQKTAFGEADELITFFTLEAGKLRGLAKSVKRSASRLQGALQSLFLVNLRLASSHRLPKIIGAEIVRTFPNLRGNPKKIAMACLGAELLIKFSADGQKNFRLFKLFVNFLKFLEKPQTSSSALAAALAKFKLDFLDCVGLALRAEGRVAKSGMVFSLHDGGFFGSDKHGKRVASQTVEAFFRLQKADFANLPPEEGEIRELQGLLTEFLEYQLERRINSEAFLKLYSGMV